MNRNDGGPAFPFRVRQEFPDGTVVHGVNEGMTLRDYFAGQALAGLLAGLDAERNKPAYMPRLSNGDSIDRAPLAETAFDYADAMLARRDA